MRPLLTLLALVLAAGPVAAQDFALRFGDIDAREGLSFDDLVDEMHAVTSWEEYGMNVGLQFVPVHLISAVVVDGEVLQAGVSEFVATRVERIGRGPTLRDARIELPREARARRAETAIGGAFFPGDMMDPDTDFFPGDMMDPDTDFFPGGQAFPGSDVASARIVGTATIDLPRALRTRPGRTKSIEGLDRQLARATQQMDREAYAAGEPFLVFFVAPPEGGGASVEVLGALRKRPTR